MLRNLLSSTYRQFRSLLTMVLTADQLTPLPKIEQLSPRVVRILGCNPGHMTLQGTNSYLVGTARRRVLIDTSNPNTGEYVENLKEFLSERDIEIESILVTHRHLDHVGMADDVVNELQTPTNQIQISKFPSRERPEMPLSEGRRYNYMTDLQTVSVEGATLQCFHTPGHTDDHLCFFLVEENALFSGDNILGEGTTIFNDLYDYMQSLKRMVDLNSTKIYPGHGPIVADPQMAINNYMEHRLSRERQILKMLLDADQYETTLGNILEVLYVNQGLPDMKKWAAGNNILQHLRKLQKEGIVKPLNEPPEDANMEWYLGQRWSICRDRLDDARQLLLTETNPAGKL